MDTEYFIIIDGQQKGPLSIEQLKAESIAPETMVWRQGMINWQPASTVPDLKVIFQPTPPNFESTTSEPTFNNEPTVTNMPDKPKSWLVESILATLFCCLPFGIVGLVNAANVDSKFSKGDYEGAAKSAAEAKRWTMVSLIIGIIVTVICAAICTIAIIYEL